MDPLPPPPPSTQILALSYIRRRTVSELDDTRGHDPQEPDQHRSDQSSRKLHDDASERVNLGSHFPHLGAHPFEFTPHFSAYEAEFLAHLGLHRAEFLLHLAAER